MKSFITLSIIFFTLIGCSSEAKDSIEDALTENEDYYDCTDFFLIGDYRTFCTVDTEIVNLLDSTIDGGGTVCAYIIPRLNLETDVTTGVYFTSLQTSAQAQSAFDAGKKRWEEEVAEDPKRFITEISIGDYDAYVSESQYANYSKSISVRYKNVLVTAGAVYFKDWFPDTAPCNYDTDQLAELMKVVLENM